MNFENLKKEGYYIRVTKGIFNNKKHVRNSLFKKDKNSERGSGTFKCYLNKKAVSVLLDKYNFEKIEDKKETIFLNYCESMGFSNQTKEPLMITFH